MYGRPDLTFRPTLRQLMPQLVLVVVAITIAALVHDDVLVAISVLGLGYVLLMWRRFGTHLTSADLVVLGMRNRVVPWTHVQDLQEHRQLGGRGLVMTDTSGHRTLLKAPRDSRLAPDPGYGAKRDEIIAAWKAERGDWRPAGAKRPSQDS